VPQAEDRGADVGAAMRTGGSFGKRSSVSAAPAATMALRSPALSVDASDSAPVPQLALTHEGIHVPYLSLAILALLSAVFWAELRYPVSAGGDMAPSLRTLIALGGLSRELVFQKGEWWRIFTAPLMHGSLSHIAGNAVALFFASRFLEKIAGWRWTAALFVLGAVGGATGSLIGNPTDLITVGASGAIMALLAALFVLSFDNQVVTNTGRLQRWTLFLLVPSLLPAATGTHVDVSAHLGGAITGGVLGYFLQIAWDEDRHRPHFEAAASLIAAAGVAMAVIAFVLVGTHYSESRVEVASVYEPKLMSDADLPADTDAGEKASADLVARFPDDPRARVYHALHLLNLDDITEAQAELRAALDQRKILEEVPPRFTAIIQILLAATLARQGRIDDAKTTAAPACSMGEDDSDVSVIMDYLKSQGVCAEPD
jgi:rhomboid protease GluP